MELAHLRSLALEIAKDLRSWSRDAGGATESLVGLALDRFEKSVRDDVLIVDAGFISEPTAPDAAALSRLLGMGGGFAGQQSFLQSALLRAPGSARAYGLRYRPILKSSVEPLGEPRGSVALLMMGEVMSAEASTADRISQFARDRLLLVHTLPAANEVQLERLAVSTRRIQALEPAGPGLAELLPPTDETIAKSVGWAGALGSVLEAAQLLLVRDQQHLRARRQDLAARIARQQAPGKAAPFGTDPLVELKARLQRAFAELERRAADRSAALLGPNRGVLVAELDRRVDAGLTMVQTTRTSAIETAVSEDFERGLNATFREEIQRLFTEEIEALNRTSTGAALTLEKGLREVASAPVSVAAHCAGLEASRKLLAALPPIQSQHRGVFATPGVADFFAKVRKYIMLLVMSASMLGLGQMFKAHREYFTPSSIVLLLFGAYTVYSARRQERIEREEEDLTEARKSLRAEYRKVASETHKLWSSSLSALSSEQSGHYLAILDAVGRDLSLRRVAEASAERERLQRQLVGVENQEKRSSAAVKSRESLIVALRPKLAKLSPDHVPAAVPPRGEGTSTSPPAPGPAAVAEHSASTLSDARARLEALRARRSQS